MVWGEIGAGLFGAGASWINQMLSYQNNKKLQENQARLNYEYAQKSAENSPTWNRAGLVSAGYNPMLAVQNATSGANSNWTGSAHADMTDPLSAASNATSIYQAGQRLENETKTAESTAELNSANARKAISEAIGQELKNPYIPQNEQTHLNQMGALTDKLIRETSFYDQLADNMEAERRLQELGIYIDLKGRMYTADQALKGSIYNADTMKDIASEHSPSGSSQSFNNYAGGVANILHGVGSVIHGYNETNNYSSGNESTTTYYDKDGKVRGSVSHTGKSSSRGTRTRRSK